MDSSRWARIEEIFRQAVARPKATRAAFLDEACAGDPEIRHEVESLLAHDSNEDDSIAAGLWRHGSPVEASGGTGPGTPEGSAGWTGRSVGPWRLEEELGRGGMGTVYRARRADGQFDQQVAVKILRLQRPELIERFRGERQILATLDHPGIARLLDGGTTDSGEPYVVMEFVEGEPLDTSSDRHHLSTRARLELFRKVCSAVQYAHRNLVVHRDLKPQNILVTPDGEPKLLDFGIAKLLDPGSVEFSVAETGEGVRLLTPAYASPEQVRGEPVSTATDVYALGVILYELLSGRRPYRPRSPEPRALEDAICTQDPERPSTAITREGDGAGTSGSTGPFEDRAVPARVIAEARASVPQRLQRELTGDLDNIVLKALRKEPERRYGSVAELDEDVRRHLEGLPVLARPATIAYRARKFLARNRAGVTVAAAGLLVVVALVAFYTMRLRDERNVALAERSRAEQIAGLMVGLFDVNAPNSARGREITAREVMDGAVERLRTELADQPEVQAKMFATIGDVYIKLGLYADSWKLLEEARETQESVLGSDHPESIRTLDLLARAYWSDQRIKEAEALLVDVADRRRRVLGVDDPETIGSLSMVAMVHWNRGDLDRAEELFLETIGAQERTIGRDHEDRLMNLNSLSVMYRRQERFKEAERLLEEAREGLERTMGTMHSTTLIVMNSQANLFKEQGRYEEAASIMKEAVAVQKELAGEDHSATWSFVSNLADLHRLRGDLEAAEPLFAQALEGSLRTRGENHPYVYDTMHKYACLLRDMGRTSEALAYFERVQEFCDEKMGPAFEMTRENLKQHAILLRETGEAEAAAALERRLAEAERSLEDAQAGG